MSDTMNYHDIQEKLKDPEYRNSDHSNLIKSLEKTLHIVVEQKNLGYDLVNILRVLRNLCINCKENQAAISHTKIPDSVVGILSNVGNDWNIEEIAKTVGLQFLGNFVSGNRKGCEYFWKSAYPAFFHNFFAASSIIDKHCVICSMILYNCLLEIPSVNDLFHEDTDEDLVVSLCNLLGNLSEPDWIVLLIKNIFFKTIEFLPLVLSKCSFSTQIQVLEMYCEAMNDEDDCGVCNDFMTAYLGNQFLERYVCRETASKDQTDVFVSILEAFCWATAIPGQWNQTLQIAESVEAVVTLLQEIHLYGKQLNEFDKTFLYHLCHSHAKRDLVRLLGNLCFENSTVQNEIRSLGGVPLILEACAIDDAHPFLQQWAVFAVRNLCQNNTANQMEVAKLEKIGVADSPVLRSMGLTAFEDENGKMRVKSL